MNQKKFLARQTSVRKLLSEQGKPSALVVSSNPHRQRTNDVRYPYRANNDLFYLTGSSAPDITLVILSDRKNPILLGHPPDPVKELWEGKTERPKSIASAIGAELVLSSDHQSALQKLLRGYDTIFTQPIEGTTSYQFGQQLLLKNATGGDKLPKTVSNTDPLLAKLRLYKSKEEISAILHAALITGEALHGVLPLIKAGIFEYEIAATIDYLFRVNRGDFGFETIVAAGPSAATLHYHFRNRKLRARDLVLIDCGAEVDMYSADITRTLPVDGKFGETERVMYEAVLSAQKAAIGKIRHGVRIRDVYLAAADALTRGLVELKVLRGKVSQLMAKSAYKSYFPHGIGHSLGLDVHDIGDLRGNNQATLETGMVFTVEPGLYFPKAVGKVPASGIRIEDDVLVTKTGCLNLTDRVFPKEVSDIEALYA